MTSVSTDLLEVLGDIERAEARLLTWGVVDSAMSDAEMIETIEASATRHQFPLDSENAFEDLLDARLVLPALDVGDQHYRTRMAEAIRLFAKLRQWMATGNWQTSPSLVADFRFMLRPRRYPRRDLTPSDACQMLDADARLPDREALRALLLDHEPHPERHLARFQFEAAQRILRGLRSGRRGGTIVTAGTGSGKTLAFYLPALAWLSGELDAAPSTRIVAIYPRNELLKDQLAQCLAEVDRIADVVQRPIRVGTLFGPTPDSPSYVVGKFNPWEAHGSGGRICPYLHCPRCRSAVVWPDEDREAKRERVVCTSPSCDWEASGDTVPLTRSSLRKTPADILFTTTEMLNRLMSSPPYRRVLGFSGAVRPSLMLLDEVHTYGGTSGAQVAHLLRRWHHAAGGRVQFVGLSATLRDAPGFFSRLTGLREDLVREVTPAPSDMEQQGMEYLLALRGNPMTQTALLSTTIQSLMLSARIVDPKGRVGVAGSRVFAFTDKLDLVNRLFHFYSDAEGWGPFGRPAGHEPLASLRAPGRFDGDGGLARAAGQVWDGPAEIGHDLTNGRVRVGITTSQQTGVQDREVIVATASLEVGYNDEQVGLVLQHKAPRDPAAFIQRRGRAGRRREQRPWTIAVLSDYGRDRIAYHAYDQLFDPALPARSLPVGNLAVRRMQAAYATVDWLSRAGPLPTSVWDELTRPRDAASQQTLGTFVEKVLTDADLKARLRRHLLAALDLDDDEVDVLLWTAPRGILTEVLPTARRRLLTSWFHHTLGPGGDLQAPTSPLPDFVPPNLFTDLQLPEVTVTTPKRRDSEDVDEHQLPVYTALSEFAPGNVSFRYALEGPWAAGWVPVDQAEDVGGEVQLGLETFCAAHDDLGTVGPPETPVRVLRPWRLTTIRRPSTVLDSSRGRLRWAGGPRPEAAGAHLDLPTGTNWEQVLRRAELHLHASHMAVTVSRYAPGFSAEVGYRHGERDHIDGRFTFDGDPAAMGFEYDADALAFYVDVPADTLLPSSEDPERLAAFRSAWFSQSLANDPILASVASIFQRQQLERAYVAMLADEALVHDLTLDAALDRLDDSALGERLSRALDILYDSGDTLDAPQRGLEDLKNLAINGTVIGALRRATAALTRPLDGDARSWARERFVWSFAAALSDASQGLCREFDLESEVTVDVLTEPDGRYSIWLVERSPGGGGVVETLARRLLEHPRRFLALLDRAVRPSDFEVVDAALQDVLSEVVSEDSPLCGLFADYRQSNSNAARSAALDAIRGELRKAGVPPIHPVVAAIATRLLRFGSTAELDRALAGMVERWGNTETQLGIELDPTMFAYTQRHGEDFDALVPMIGGATPRRRFEVAAASLWMRGWRARAEGLQTYSPYHDSPPTDRLALDRFRGSAAAPVSLDSPEWRAELDHQLSAHGIATITHRRAEPVAAAIRAVTVIPTDTGPLLLHPVVIAVDTTVSGWEATLIVDDGAAG